MLEIEVEFDHEHAQGGCSRQGIERHGEVDGKVAFENGQALEEDEHVVESGRRSVLQREMDQVRRDDGEPIQQGRIRRRTGSHRDGERDEGMRAGVEEDGEDRRAVGTVKESEFAEVERNMEGRDHARLVGEAGHEIERA